MKNSVCKKLIRGAQFVSMVLLMLAAITAQADHEQLIMGRSTEAFPETMSALQEEIRKAGYTISIVQRVDVGLTGMGFKTDKYRVVFFGKPEEIKTLPKKYPELTPYLPLAIAIFAEEDETILTAMSPHFIEPFYAPKKDGKEAELYAILQGWQQDIQVIIENISHLE
jgi:uncharacterized protein (DUF302 family)